MKLIPRGAGRSRKFWRFLSFLIVTGILTLVISSTIDRIFKIKVIKVIGVGVEMQVERSRLPQNLLFFPTRQIENEIKKHQPLVETVIIRKKYPQTLEIEVKRRFAIARLKTSRGELQLDKDGVVMGDEQRLSSDLPILFFPQEGEFKTGTVVSDQSVRQALKFVELTQGFLQTFEISKLDDKSLRSRSEKTEIFFPQQGDLHELASTLQTLTTGFRIKGTLPKLMDLRFEKPIVTF
ncbi:MAG: cell division protein FtsQ/DivIB [Patescibacteria group bacterium]